MAAAVRSQGRKKTLGRGGVMAVEDLAAELPEDEGEIEEEMRVRKRERWGRRG